MARAKLIANNDNRRTYQIIGNRKITIDINDDSEITYWENGARISDDDEFVFIQDEFQPSKYLLARMYAPIKNVGLGRATIEFFKDYYEAIIYARQNDGIDREDGSHLTEDAPGFVAKMIDEGLLNDV